MRTMTMNRKITLQQYKDQQGHSGGETLVTEAEVFASVRVPSLSFRSHMAAAGWDTALTVVVWRSEFDAAPYTHAIVDGVLYRIADTGAGVNDLFVSLALERG